jgi:hypothetical protein
LCFLYSWDDKHIPQCATVYEMGSCELFAPADLKLQSSQVARIIGISHHTWPLMCRFCSFKFFTKWAWASVIPSSWDDMCMPPYLVYWLR